MFLFKKIKPVEREPIGVMAEKTGKIYEIRLFFTPDPYLDGEKVIGYDAIYKVVAETKLKILAQLYVFKLANKFNLMHKSVS